MEIEGNIVSFGRLPSPDARDGLHPMSLRLPPARVRTGIVLWDMPFPALNQGSDGVCVGASWEGWMLTNPVIRKQPGEWPSFYQIYDRATEIDEWQGNEHDRSFGTSVRAGAEVMRENGFTAEYVHAQHIDDLLAWISDVGPAVVGTSWLEGMTYRHLWKGDFLTLYGNKIGDHAYLVRGIDWDRQALRIRNSWGTTWGPWYNGDALISFTDMETLIFKSGGDCVAAAEVSVTPPEPPPPPVDEIVTPTFEFGYQGVQAGAMQYVERFSWPNGGGPQDLSLGPRIEVSPWIWNEEIGAWTAVEALYKHW